MFPPGRKVAGSDGEGRRRVLERRSGERQASEARHVTAAQCREARRLLGWSLHQLASAAGTYSRDIRRFERVGLLAKPKSGEDRRAAISAVLEQAGVEFTNGDAPGVRLRPKRGMDV